MPVNRRMMVEADPNDVPDDRTPVTLVAGLDRDAVSAMADALVVAGTTLVHHDLDSVFRGCVTRTVRAVDQDGIETDHATDLELAHGCVSCTVRDDLLGLLRRLHRRDSVDHVVIRLDPRMEPEALSWAIDNAVVGGLPGYVDAPAGTDVRIDATVTCVSEDGWLDAAIGDDTLAETFGPEDLDDERTLAQVAVGQVAFADALVVRCCDPAVRDNWAAAQLMAVLTRLAPQAPVLHELPQRPIRPLPAMQLLRAIPADSRRGRVDGPHDPLLRGLPPLTPDCGVALVDFTSDRPFHPERLHDAIDVLLDGVVCARGRMWSATRPDEALWLESAGGGLRVGDGGPWLAAMTPDECGAADPQRRAMSALHWDDDHGDRHTSLVILVHRADPGQILSALHGACLTDAEMALGQTLWLAYPDPFGAWHADPCEDLDDERAPHAATADTTADMTFPIDPIDPPTEEHP